MERLLRGVRNMEDAERMLMGMEGAMEQVYSSMKLTGDGLRIWRRFASRVLTYQVEFLEVAVRQGMAQPGDEIVVLAGAPDEELPTSDVLRVVRVR